jgi:hypothetical protein
LSRSKAYCIEAGDILGMSKIYGPFIRKKVREKCVQKWVLDSIRNRVVGP